jgi:hypothetical protein
LLGLPSVWYSMVSREQADICYRYKYISPATKVVILSELCRRVASIEEAHNVVGSVGFHGVMELLQARDAMVRTRMCEILAGVAFHESTVTVVLGLGLCVQLVSLVQ